jgi:cysteine sulfinate desulfinase/cysteine desulfurase-like protein
MTDTAISATNRMLQYNMRYNTHVVPIDAVQRKPHNARKLYWRAYVHACMLQSMLVQQELTDKSVAASTGVACTATRSDSTRTPATL